MIIRNIKKYLNRIRWHYKFKKIHNDNIEKGRTIHPARSAISTENKLKIFLSKVYAGSIEINKKKFYFEPAATINLGNTPADYLKHIGAKSRNMIRKAQKNGYKFEAIDLNNHLKEIYEINLSSVMRQGQMMSSDYREYPKKQEYFNNEGYLNETCGITRNGVVVAYCELYFYEGIISINKILGHKKHLHFGIMNLLIYEIFLWTKARRGEYLIYLSMVNTKKNTLAGFKKRAGFENYSIHIV